MSTLHMTIALTFSILPRRLYALTPYFQNELLGNKTRYGSTYGFTDKFLCVL